MIYSQLFWFNKLDNTIYFKFASKKKMSNSFGFKIFLFKFLLKS